MNEVIETTAKPADNRAMRVHYEIIASKKQVAVGLYELARGLKEMRDAKLYIDLGYDKFDSYCSDMAKVNVSQAYKYIKTYEELGGSALQSTGELGIEKLFLVSQLPPEEKNDAIAHPETIEGMTVPELRAFIAKARQQGEQLSLLSDELEDAKAKLSESESSDDADIDAIERELREKIEHELEDKHKSELDAKTAALSKEYADLASEKNALARELDTQKQKEQKLVEKARKDAEKVFLDTLGEAKAKAVADAEAAVVNKLKAEREQLEQLKATVSEMSGKNSELEKQLKLSNSAIITFKLYTSALSDDYNKLIAFIGTLDGEDNVKCKSALVKLVDKLKSTTDSLIGTAEGK